MISQIINEMAINLAFPKTCLVVIRRHAAIFLAFRWVLGVWRVCVWQVTTEPLVIHHVVPTVHRFRRCSVEGKGLGASMTK